MVVRPYVFWLNFQQNIVTILINDVFRSATLLKEETLIRGRHLFQCRYPKVRRLLEEAQEFNPVFALLNKQ